MGLAAFPIFTLAALSPLVVTELGLTRTQLGAVSTTMFATGVAGSLLLGRLVDRVGARRVLVGLFVTSSVAVTLLATAGTFAALLGTGVVVGLAQAAANPATNAVVSRHIDVAHRGRVMGVKQSGVPLAQFLAGAVLAPLAAVIGWRPAVLLGYTLVVPAVIATILVLPRDRVTGGAGHGPRLGMPPALGWLFGCTFLLALALQATNVYLPLYAFEEVGTSPSVAGVVVGVVGVLGVTSRIVFGRLAGRSRRPARLVAVIAVAATGATTAIAAAPTVGSASLWFGALVDLTGSYRFVWSLVAASCAGAALVAVRASLRAAVWHEDVAVRS